MPPYSEWLEILSWLYLIASFACAAIIAVDEFRRPQKMMIMNFVWPITALYFGPLALWGYRKSGAKMTKQHSAQMQEEIRRELQREAHVQYRKSAQNRAAPLESRQRLPFAIAARAARSAILEPSGGCLPWA